MSSPWPQYPGPPPGIHQPGAYPPGAYGPPPYGGYPVDPYAGYPPNPPPSGPRNGFGLAALICGFLGVVSGVVYFLFPLAGVLGLVAVVLGPVGLGRVRRAEADNYGVALVGTVLGVIACVLSVVGLVVTVNKVTDGIGKVGSYVECVAEVDADDPQRQARINACDDRF